MFQDTTDVNPELADNETADPEDETSDPVHEMVDCDHEMVDSDHEDADVLLNEGSDPNGNPDPHDIGDKNVLASNEGDDDENIKGNDVSTAMILRAGLRKKN